MASLQERVEGSVAGRILLSVVVVVTLAGSIVWNAPDSHLKHDLRPVVNPVVLGEGLEQDWKTYAPNPRRGVLALEARAEFADGTVQTWRVPRRDRFVGTYSEYRWRKWVEHVTKDKDPDAKDMRKELWEPAALYVARTLQHGGHPPVRVTLVRRWYDLPPPGHADTRPHWQEAAYYTLDVTPAVVKNGAGS